MSSVESAPKGILKSARSKAALRKKRVRFDDTAQRYSIRKPVQVLNFVRESFFNGSLLEYFEKDDIGGVPTWKTEVSADTEFRNKFSHNTDLCIVFNREDLPLSFFYPTIDADLEKLRADNPNLRILQIEVQRGRDFSDYIKETINKVKTVYTKDGERPEITKLKNELAENVRVLLSEFGPESTELTKRVAFRDLIRLYVAIDNADPGTILGYYESYREELNQLKEKFEKDKKDFFYGKDFQNINQFNVTLSRLEAALNEDKECVWVKFRANIKQHYPKQLVQQASGSVAEDSEKMERIVEHTAVVMTLVETPDKEMDDAEVKSEKISSTPFWSAQPAQIVKNSAAERRQPDAMVI